MKKGYLETSLLFLFVYFGWKFQLSMSRHARPRRPIDPEDCRRCEPGFGVTRHCNRHRDTECTACSPGHYSSHHSARRPCYPCSRCGLGLYVAHRCTASRDTVCDSCHTYKGPHNEDFYERCIKPLAGTMPPRQEGYTKESEDRSLGVPTYIVIMSGVAIGVLSVALVAACVLVSTRRRCKRVDHRYEAVATQEAVML